MKLKKGQWVLALIIGINLVVIFLWWKKNRTKPGIMADATQTDNSPKKAETVGEKISKAAQKSLTQPDPHIKKYTGWLDWADNESAKFKSNTLTVSNQLKKTIDQIEGNLATIANLPEDMFKMVVDAWMKTRKYKSYTHSKLYKSNLFLAPSRLAFLNRCKQLKIK